MEVTIKGQGPENWLYLYIYHRYRTACRASVGGQTRFACVDGPKFDGHQVDWDVLLARQRFYLEAERRAVEKWSGSRTAGR